MPVFDYKAIDNKGKERTGVIEAESAKAVRVKLRDQNLIPIDVAISSGKQTSSDSILNFDLSWNKNKLKVAELALVTRQLSTLLASGLPIDESLQAVAEQTENDKVARIVKGVRSRVMEGHSLSASMAEYKQAFPDLYRASINAGEHSGYLHMVLESLADYTEKEHYVKSKIRQASIYPTMVISVSVIIVIVLLTYIVPQMVDTFREMGHELPRLTLVVIAISDFLRDYGLYFLVGIILTVIFFRRTLRTNEDFKYKFHAFLLKLPMIGKIIRTSDTARFARTFGVLSMAGVSVLEAMTTSKHVVKNLLIKEALEEAMQKVKEGVNISRSLKETKYFPAMSIHLIASGETSGKLEYMLDKAASYQEKEIEGLISTFLSLFEPLMIILIGFVVLLIVVAIFVPIMQVNQLVGQ